MWKTLDEATMRLAVTRTQTSLQPGAWSSIQPRGEVLCIPLPRGMAVLMVLKHAAIVAHGHL